MARILSVLLFVLAVSAAPMPSNPFDGTATSVEQEGTPTITYSGLDHSITITDRGEGSWTVDIVNGQATFEVPEEAEGFLELKDTLGNGWWTDIVEG